MELSPSALPGARPALDERQQRRVLLAVCLPLMAVSASASGLNVVQQDLAIDLGASQSQVLWIINAYTVVLAALLLPLGAMADRLGRKPVLLVGLALFAVASLATTVAGSVAVVIVARVSAGVAAAMIMPVTLSVITASFPPEARSQGIGVWSAVAGVGGLVGMLTFALLADVASWEWTFALPVALVVVAVPIVVRSVPSTVEAQEGRFDVLGAVLSVVAVGGLVLAIDEGAKHGLTASWTLVGLGTGLTAAIGFIIFERRTAAPMLDVRAFRDRRLAAGASSLLVAFGILGGVFVVLFPFFQTVLGWSALQSIAGILPMALLMMLSSGLAPVPAKRLGQRGTILIGLAVAGVGLTLLAVLTSVEGGYLSVIPGMVVIGAGMGLVMTPSTEAITSALPASRQGLASALNDVTRELGTAFGVAALGAVLTAGYRSSLGALDSLPEAAAEQVRAGIGTAVGAATQLSDTQGEAVFAAAREAFVSGWTRSMWVGVGSMAVLFVCILLRGPIGAVAVGEPVDLESPEVADVPSTGETALAGDHDDRRAAIRPSWRTPPGR